MPRADHMLMPVEYYEGQEPGFLSAAGNVGQGIGGNMLQRYVGQSLFGGGAAAAAPTAAQAGMTTATAMGMAQGAGKGAMGAFGFGGGAGAGAGAAGLSAAIPAIGLGIMVVGGLLSAFGSKPKKKTGYQKVPVAPRRELPIPQLSNYGVSLPPGFRA